MRGESVNEVELFIRNAKMPTAVYSSITGNLSWMKKGALRAALSFSTISSLQNERRKPSSERRKKAESAAISRSVSLHNEPRTTHAIERRLGFSDLLADERYGTLNDRQQRYVGHINTGGKHLLKLISDILDLSKSKRAEWSSPRGCNSRVGVWRSDQRPFIPLAERNRKHYSNKLSPSASSRDAMRLSKCL